MTKSLCIDPIAYARGEVQLLPMKLGRRKVLSPRAACLIEGCEKHQQARGLCSMHYQRLRRIHSVSKSKKQEEI